jgi:arylsulfatase
MSNWKRLFAAGCALVFLATSAWAQGSDRLDRTVLPIPQPVPKLITEQDVRKAQMPARLDLTAPKGAPNVLLVLIDDMGFGQPAAFGGPINMPTLDRVAQRGLRYNRFHTAAVCSATRAALLNGNNAHTVNAGEIADNATGFPGNTFVRVLVKPAVLVGGDRPNKWGVELTYKVIGF